MVYTQVVYIPGGVYPGIPRVYTPGGAYPGSMPPYHAGYTPPWVYAPLYTPGYTRTLLYMDRCTLLMTCTQRCAEREPWAQGGRKAWVRAPVRVNVVIPVKVGGSVCAELLRSPSEERAGDRIDEGTPYGISLW